MNSVSTTFRVPCFFIGLVHAHVFMVHAKLQRCLCKPQFHGPIHGTAKPVPKLIPDGHNICFSLSKFFQKIPSTLDFLKPGLLPNLPLYHAGASLRVKDEKSNTWQSDVFLSRSMIQPCPVSRPACYSSCTSACKPCSSPQPVMSVVGVF